MTANICRFATLRCMPDTLRAEHVNIGVVLFAVDGSYAKLRLTNDWSRAAALCPPDNTDWYKEIAENYVQAVRDGSFTLAELDHVAGNYGPYSSIHWSPCGASIDTDYDAVLDEIFAMMVTFPAQYGTHRVRETEL